MFSGATMHYPLQVAGVKRNLTLFPISDDLQIAAFILLGDQELTVACARALLERVPAYDYILTAEAKGIPLAHEMARQAGAEHYIVARKKMKLYMGKAICVDVQSITTAEMMKGKRVLIIDDVISTGKSLEALESLALKAGAQICGRAAVLAEGDAAQRDDIIYLEPLPLFDKNGHPLS